MSVKIEKSIGLRPPKNKDKRNFLKLVGLTVLGIPSWPKLLEATTPQTSEMSIEDFSSKWEAKINIKIAGEDYNDKKNGSFRTMVSKIEAYNLIERVQIIINLEGETIVLQNFWTNGNTIKTWEVVASDNLFIPKGTIFTAKKDLSEHKIIFKASNKDATEFTDKEKQIIITIKVKPKQYCSI